MKFSELGAESVLGIDVSDTWLEKARFAASVLEVEDVEFQNVDFLNFDGSRAEPVGLISDAGENIPLPKNQFDVIFMSTVIDHLFFPLLSIYKMIKLARQHVVIDCPCTHFDVIYGRGAMTLSVAEDGSHHGFVATPKFWQEYISRLGIPEQDLTMNFYNEDQSVCMVIDVTRAADRLRGA